MSAAQDWEARVDPSTGRTFYVNHKTKQTSWTLPTTKTATEDTPLPDGWTATVDERTGRTYYVNHKQRRTTWTDPRTSAVMRNEKVDDDEHDHDQEQDSKPRSMSDPSAPPLQTPVKDSDATSKDIIILENKRFALILAVEHLVVTERKKFRVLVQDQKNIVTRYLDESKTSILTEDDTISGAALCLLETSQSHFPQLQLELVDKITDAESVLVSNGGILRIGISLQNALANKDMKLAASSLRVLHRTLKERDTDHEKAILENFSKREASLMGLILTCLSQDDLPDSVREPAFGVLYELCPVISSSPLRSVLFRGGVLSLLSSVSSKEASEILSRLLTNLSKDELDVLIEIDAVKLISKMKNQTSLLLEILQDKRSHASFLKCGGVDSLIDTGDVRLLSVCSLSLSLPLLYSNTHNINNIKRYLLKQMHLLFRLQS